MNKPSLGMIPIFMAGDKQYFWHASELRKQLNLELVFFGGNPLEKTGFKTEFAGAKENAGRPYDISFDQKLSLVKYYSKEFLLSPKYLICPFSIL